MDWVGVEIAMGGLVHDNSPPETVRTRRAPTTVIGENADWAARNRLQRSSVLDGPGSVACWT